MISRACCCVFVAILAALVATPARAQTVRGWGSTPAANVPADLGPCKRVALGTWHSVAIRQDGEVRAWGNNNWGQCFVPIDLGQCVAIAAGAGHTLAVRHDGTVRAWGSNVSGQCDVPLDLGPCIAVAAGSLHSIALRQDGMVNAWGQNSAGECDVPPDLGPCSSVVAGASHSLALREDGTVRAWGSNDRFQCNVPLDLGPCRAVAAGSSHSIALRQDGVVRVWGSNSSGQTSVPSGLGPCVGIAGTRFTTAAIREDGSVRVWGSSDSGHNDLPDDLGPAAALASGNGWGHMLALTCDGVDCDGNGSPDFCDISYGAEDVNENGALDTCELNYGDLNLDGVIDGVDLAGLLAAWGSAHSSAGDINGDGVVDGADVTFLLARWGPLAWAPTVDFIWPSSGPSMGGTVITIRGFQLYGASSVTVCGTPATNVQWIDSSTVRAVTPPGIPGECDVAVTIPSGTVVRVRGFRYAAPPQLVQMSPSAGPVAGGTQFTLSGSNLAGVSALMIGGGAATNVQVLDASTITAWTPSALPGSYDVTVATPGGSAVLPNAFTYHLPPVVDSVSPTTATVFGPFDITITGSSLSGTTGVRVGTADATNVMAGSPNTVTATVPQLSAGSRDLLLTTPGGTATLSGAVTVISPPTIASLSPNASPPEGGIVVTVAGANLLGATSMTIGGVPVAQLTVLDASTATAVVPPGLIGLRDVVINTPYGVGGRAGVFRYAEAPVLTSVSPPVVPSAGGSTITLIGTNLTAATEVTVGGVPATQVRLVDENTMTARTPPGRPGLYDVRVTTVSGSATTREALRYEDVAPVGISGIASFESGTPAMGAAVSTSRGGFGYTDQSGSFEIDAYVTQGPTTVEITVSAVVEGVHFRGTVSVSDASAGQSYEVGPVLLTRSSSDCAGNHDWTGTFGSWDGFDGGHVFALASADEGGEAVLYAGGSFTRFGGSFGVEVNRVAKWDGTVWTALGTGVDAPVYALAPFDDGDGTALFVGGQFTTAGGVSVRGIAKWNGHSWSSVGAGVDGVVYAMAVFDDGSGPALFVGGTFSEAGGAPAMNIARWDGVTWSPVGGGCDSAVQALAVHANDAGSALYVGGRFSQAGDVPASCIAKWDGSHWTALGGGVSLAGSNLFSGVSAIAGHWIDGSPTLFVGGDFVVADGVGGRNVAKWDGDEWSILGGGTDGPVAALAVYDGGSGPELYANGFFSLAGQGVASSIAKWNGDSWVALSERQPMVDTTFFGRALVVHQSNSGPTLCFGGHRINRNFVMQWDGESVSGLGASHFHVGDRSLTSRPYIAASVVHDAGFGPTLYVGGRIPTVQGIQVNNVAGWNGSEWAALGAGLNGDVTALEVYDDGTGPALFAAGVFTDAGGLPANGLARWDGHSWMPVVGGPSGIVRDFAVFNSGTGAELYLGGTFGVAKWNGKAWTTYGSNGAVDALLVADLGSGSELYVAGEFTLVSGVSASRIAKWNGDEWAGLDGGVSGVGSVKTLALYNDGSGPKLYAGGSFQTIGDQSAPHMAKWDGTAWSRVGSANISGRVTELLVFDDGSGPRLYAAGFFSQIGGVSFLGRFAAWDGSEWTPSGSFHDSGGSSVPAVDTMTVYDDGHGPALFVAGPFRDSGSWNSYMARYGCIKP